MPATTSLVFCGPADIGCLMPVVRAVGTDDFASTLVDVANAQFGAAEVFAFILPAHSPERTSPIAFASLYDDVDVRVENYCRHFAPFDSTLHQFAENGPGQVAIARTWLSQRPRDRYRAIFCDRSGLDERLSIGFNSDDLIVLNIYQPRGVSMSPENLERLCALAPTLLSAIGAHHQASVRSRAPGTVAAARAAAQSPSQSEAIEAMLAEHRPDMPTRELEVCARTVIGMTAQAISIDLGISISTVATYRRRAYSRMGICSAYELMGALMRSKAHVSAPAAPARPHAGLACVA
jgi:DNA-binding CsgD family transcriptional regulator